MAAAACLSLMTRCIQGAKVPDLLELARQEQLDSRLERPAASLANMAARHRQMAPAKMVLTNNAPKRIRRERRDWRELVETRLSAKTHHMLTKTASLAFFRMKAMTPTC